MLTDVKLRAVKPGEKPFKLYDSGGLYLYVTPKGTKSWRFDYKRNGKRKTVVLGTYPEVSLRDARLKRDEFRLKLKKGLVEEKKNVLFQDVAIRWFSSRTGLSHGHLRTIKYRLDAYVLPYLGSRRLDEITRAEILTVLEGIKKTGKLETARRVQMIISQIFKYAMTLSLTDRNPADGLLQYFPENKRHYPTILDPIRIGKLILDIENSDSGLIVKLALKFLMLTFVRPGELRLAKWSEFNLREGSWDIPAERMKTKRPHRVFLSRQAIDILNVLKDIPPQSEYVFRGMYGQPLSEMTLNRALQRMGYNTKTDITAHGFRAMARTLIHEKLGYPPEVIEHQLAHVSHLSLNGAYDRTMFYEQRKRMMQDWADYLDRMRKEYITSLE